MDWFQDESCTSRENSNCSTRWKFFIFSFGIPAPSTLLLKFLGSAFKLKTLRHTVQALVSAGVAFITSFFLPGSA